MGKVGPEFLLGIGPCCVTAFPQDDAHWSPSKISRMMVAMSAGAAFRLKCLQMIT